MVSLLQVTDHIRLQTDHRLIAHRPCSFITVLMSWSVWRRQLTASGLNNFKGIEIASLLHKNSIFLAVQPLFFLAWRLHYVKLNWSWRFSQMCILDPQFYKWETLHECLYNKYEATTPLLIKLSKKTQTGFFLLMWTKGPVARQPVGDVTASYQGIVRHCWKMAIFGFCVHNNKQDVMS